MLEPTGKQMLTREVDQATQHREGGKYHQRYCDHEWTFFGMRGSFRTRLTKEDHPNLTSHVKGCQECSDTEKNIDPKITLAGIQQNFIFRPEPCKRDNARQCQCADQINPKRYRHGLAHPAHVAHVIRI